MPSPPLPLSPSPPFAEIVNSPVAPPPEPPPEPPPPHAVNANIAAAATDSVIIFLFPVKKLLSIFFSF
ncbi:MAG: hypothetical protein P794_05955 [Epsilonproteobacteria bacterium (ex Lamellibrachia satsuma)]|nr:MAG: hypothetical protein P794_05955 [Epsilonproteobacteria bacterium (ex Lamellibrachia satsuma)]